GAGEKKERIQVTFTPSVCKVRCAQGRCVNVCDRGDVTTVYSSDGTGQDSAPFRVFLCPLLCKNGGLCLQKDRCLCPPNFTGKFCQIPVSPTSSNASSASHAHHALSSDHSPTPSPLSANQELTHSEFVLPLGPNQETQSAGAPSPPMVKVRVQHPPEASVKVHQVLKVKHIRTLSQVRSGVTSGSSGFPLSQVRSGVTSGSAGFPAPVSRGVQAQTVTGGGTYTHQSGFKYCFREVQQGQCSSPLPGLRSRETCCRGVGKAWGINDCELCPNRTDKGDSSCPLGYESVNGTKCEDINECEERGRCEHGLCVNTRGSYSCVCSEGFILDATHGLCISHRVISEEKGQCFRVVSPLSSPSSCSLPILRSITKQICCCSRVGKAWGEECERCPPFGSAAFKEICPAGPGYHYSASALQFNQRAIEQLGHRSGPASPQSSQRQGHGSSSSSSSVSSSSVSSSSSSLPTSRDKPQNPRPSPPGQGTSSGCLSLFDDVTLSSGVVRAPSRPEQARPRPQSPVTTTTTRRPTTTSTRPPRVPSEYRTLTNKPSSGQGVTSQHTVPPTGAVGACQARPGVCGRGLCVNQPLGRHSCVCHYGYELNALNTSCQDTDECRRSPCGPHARCENNPGSYRCVCHHGYKLRGLTCTDVDECEDPLLCPGQECVNSAGSYSCVTCRAGFGLLHRRCTDIDECRQAPCTNGRCQNTPGSYRCICRHGYRLSNNTCSDIDECADPSQCPGQMCVNSVGSYRCVSCRHGYRLHNRQCIDVDECQESGSCPSHSQCVNTLGSFRCDCAPGYRPGPGRSCADIDECLQGALCSGGDCLNTPGSFSCVCAQGYSLSHNKTLCNDIDECLRSGVCEGGHCVNSQGSYHCVCDRGYSPSPERSHCLDVDECVSSRGSVCGAQSCENTIGSFRCLSSCQPGFTVSPTGECVGECGRASGTRGGHLTLILLLRTAALYYVSSHSGSSRFSTGSSHSSSVSHTSGSSPSVGSSVSRSSPSSPLPDASSLSPDASSLPFSSLPPGVRGELRECYYDLESGVCSVLSSNTTAQECCCTEGPGWGRGCVYHTCPLPHTDEFQSLCPNGRGYVTTGPGASDYRDVDECKRFGPEVCKSGVCVNNIPGFNCYCSSGYTYNRTLLECADHDECEEESCSGGLCVNTQGSFYCSCPHPLVLDETQRNCVNDTQPTLDENVSLCWQHVSADLLCQSLLLGAQLSFSDCCCLYGDGWGLECALCPRPDTEDYARLCSTVHSPLYPEPFPDLGTRPGSRAEPPREGLTGDRYSVYGSRFSPDGSRFSPDGSSFSPDGSRFSTDGSSFSPDGSRFSTDRSRFSPDGSRFSSDSRPFLVPPDPRSEEAFEVQTPPASDGFYPETREEDWRRFPPFTRPGPRRVYDSQYIRPGSDLAVEEDCGIVDGCVNGRCIRVGEGYTCDCYHGYELDLTAMTCTDVNECEGGVRLEFPCINARCVNTEGSYRCVCRRGYVLSNRPNYCVSA
ncbi:hypothetical protein NQD34_010006, partial [Periophthalmus magnuspinnatus]